MNKLDNDLNKYDEKGVKSYTMLGASLINDDLGMVGLDYQMNRAKNEDNNVDELFDKIYDNIMKINDTKVRKENFIYLIKLIFKIRDIDEGNGERLYFYKLILKLNEVQPN